MIASLSEIKALLAITTTTQDNLININIPIIEDDIREYCNNGFRNARVEIQSGAISFTRNSTSADTIDLDLKAGQNGFIEFNFKADKTVQVQRSYNNDGFFEVETVSSATLTMYTTSNRPYYEPLITENESAFVQITQIEYPNALKSVMAQMVKYKLSNYDYNIKSETVSRYSVAFKDDIAMSGGYPKAIMSSLDKWRNVVFI